MCNFEPLSSYEIQSKSDINNLVLITWLKLIPYGKIRFNNATHYDLNLAKPTAVRNVEHRQAVTRFMISAQFPVETG
jgi:hypothetical protein